MESRRRHALLLMHCQAWCLCYFLSLFSETYGGEMMQQWGCFAFQAPKPVFPHVLVKTQV